MEAAAAVAADGVGVRILALAGNATRRPELAALLAEADVDEVLENMSSYALDENLEVRAEIEPPER